MSHDDKPPSVVALVSIYEPSTQTIAKCHGLLQEKARLRASSLRAATVEEKEKLGSSLEPAASVRKPRSAGGGRALGAFGVEACFDNDSLYRPRGHV
ncbi:hypothetical protein AK812_SmicGene9999 [Symbiodinium microadriaticum]|uniref:Uncharacterized protein n=1 Tax=Symbiodinium microadriaticum TaxID=2951 RepID=A0A1Q9EGW9_SYMMI|nr:hypothetical protein AK812_SmicGene9999 [Symbiodinium microadriaticum]